MKLIPYRKKDKWGFCNLKRQIIIECRYDNIIVPFIPWNYDLALVSNNNKSCWINQSGIQISPWADRTVPFTYYEISVIIIDIKAERITNGEPNCLFINSRGEEVFKIDVLKASHFTDKKCVVLSNSNQYGAINEKGQFIVACKHSDPNEVYKIIRQSSKSDNNAEINYAKQPKNTVLFSADGCLGYKDLKGKIIIPPIYRYAFDFKEETALVAMNNKGFHHIDLQGERLYDKDYYFGYSFNNGIAKVVTNEIVNEDPRVFSNWGVEYYVPENARWGFIDKLGNEYWED